MIRAFDGSLADAEGLLAVEQATFAECPYTAHQIQAMLRPGSGPQRAWLAVDPAGAPGGAPQRETVAGFCIAFPVSSLRGAWWEIDLLAVRPDRQGCGLGWQLIQAAAAGGEGLAGLARAVVAAGNRRSARAFAHAGLTAEPSPCTLLIRRLSEQAPGLKPAPGVAVRKAAETHNRPGPALLLAEEHGRPAGHAELIEVETLLYRGIWIESLAAPSRAAREALVCHAMSRALASGLDEVSAMVPRQDQPLLHTLLAAGFRSMGAYYWFNADLPLRSSGP